MRLRHLLLAAGALGALAAPSTALAGWTAPATIDRASQANPLAQSGGVLLGWLAPAVSLAARSGDGFAAPKPITVADPFEKAWAAGLAANGDAIVLTVRKHKPLQRVRATFVTDGGARSGPVTISDRTHSAAQPRLDVAADGTAVAAWQWHDPAGWRAQVAIRRPGDARFGTPQNVSPPVGASGRAQPRPWIHVAAGLAGRAVVTWQVGGDYRLPEAPLHVATAGADSVFGADQALGDAGGLADVGLAAGPDGAVQVAYMDEHFLGHPGTVKLHVAQGVAGERLSEPVVLSRGGTGTTSGTQIAAAFSRDGTATVAWGKPSADNEEGGALEVFTRPAGGAFGAPQQLADGAQGIVLAGGPGGAAVLSWMRGTFTAKNVSWTVHAATRPAAGGAFGPDEAISAAEHNALWPTVAMTDAGDAVASWITNDDGSGGGRVAAAVYRTGQA
jgi:hypothetical protein